MWYYPIEGLFRDLVWYQVRGFIAYLNRSQCGEDNEIFYVSCLCTKFMSKIKNKDNTQYFVCEFLYRLDWYWYYHIRQPTTHSKYKYYCIFEELLKRRTNLYIEIKFLTNGKREINTLSFTWRYRGRKSKYWSANYSGGKPNSGLF